MIGVTRKRIRMKIAALVVLRKSQKKSTPFFSCTLESVSVIYLTPVMRLNPS